MYYIYVFWLLVTTFLEFFLAIAEKKEKNHTPKQPMVKTLKSGEWLTDEHIVLAQEVLRNQFPHVDGLQLPLLKST